MTLMKDYAAENKKRERQEDRRILYTILAAFFGILVALPPLSLLVHWYFDLWGIQLK